MVERKGLTRKSTADARVDVSMRRSGSRRLFHTPSFTPSTLFRVARCSLLVAASREDCDPALSRSWSTMHTRLHSCLATLFSNTVQCSAQA